MLQITTHQIPNEPRNAVLSKLGLASAVPDLSLQHLVQEACSEFGVSMAAVTIISGSTQYIVASTGMGAVQQTSREIAFCRYTIHSDHVFAVPDTRADPDFRDNPLVTRFPFYGSYAGAPIISEEHCRLGAFCIMDRQPFEVTEAMSARLKVYARRAMMHFEMKHRSRRFGEHSAVARLLDEADISPKVARAEDAVHAAELLYAAADAGMM